MSKTIKTAVRELNREVLAGKAADAGEFVSARRRDIRRLGTLRSAQTALRAGDTTAALEKLIDYLCQREGVK